MLRFQHAGLGFSRRLEMVPLQLRKRAPQLAVTDLGTPGKPCFEGSQECSLFMVAWRTASSCLGVRIMGDFNEGAKGVAASLASVATSTFR